MKNKEILPELTYRNLQIDVLIGCSYWEDALPDVVKLTKNACKAACLMTRAGTDQNMIEVSIMLADNNLIKSLNHEYLNRNEPTNVLSFPTGNKKTPHRNFPILLGDIIIAYETVVNEAIVEGKSLRDHLCHLVVHGMLHLLGFDHEGSSDADIMETIEIDILQKLNIANPYQSRGFKGSSGP